MDLMGITQASSAMPARLLTLTKQSWRWECYWRIDQYGVIMRRRGVQPILVNHHQALFLMLPVWLFSSFKISSSYMQLRLCDCDVIFPFAFAWSMWCPPHFVSQAHLHLCHNVSQKAEKEEWHPRMNAFFIIMDSLHFSAGSERKLFLKKLLSAPWHCTMFGRHPKKK